MANLNQVKISGNVGKDAEYRPEIGNGLATFGLAHNRYRPTDEGYAKMPTQWFRCVGWGKVAQELAQLKKGQRVSVVGHLESREWTDAKGVHHHAIEIVVERFSLDPDNDKAPNSKAPKEEEDDDVPPGSLPPTQPLPFPQTKPVAAGKKATGGKSKATNA